MFQQEVERCLKLPQLGVIQELQCSPASECVCVALQATLDLLNTRFSIPGAKEQSLAYGLGCWRWAVRVKSQTEALAGFPGVEQWCMRTLRVKSMTDSAKDSLFLCAQSLSVKLILLMKMGMLCVIFTSLQKSLHYKAAVLVFFPTYQNKYSDRSTWHKRGHVLCIYIYLCSLTVCKMQFYLDHIMSTWMRTGKLLVCFSFPRITIKVQLLHISTCISASSSSVNRIISVNLWWLFSCTSLCTLRGEKRILMLHVLALGWILPGMWLYNPMALRAHRVIWEVFDIVLLLAFAFRRTHINK